jgi:hypothetical protein
VITCRQHVGTYQALQLLLPSSHHAHVCVHEPCQDGSHKVQHDVQAAVAVHEDRDAKEQAYIFQRKADNGCICHAAQPAQITTVQVPTGDACHSTFSTA